MSQINITEQEVDKLLLELLVGHSGAVKINEKNFLDLLKNSLSLSIMEKKKVIDAVPNLSQFQFDELAKVFIEEREKFKELAKDHSDDIKKLLNKQQTDWIQLGSLYKAEKENKGKQEEEKQKIDDIKKNLGL